MSLLADVKGTLLGWIRDGKYPPGSQLPSVPELVRRLEVSRTVVREALQGLAAMNLVEMKPGSGCYIKAISPELIGNAEAVAPLLDLVTLIEVASARKVIEGAVAALAATTAGPEDFEVMAAVLDRIGRLVDKGRPMFEATPGFHVAVARATHNKILENVVGSFNSLMAMAGRVIEQEFVGQAYRVEEFEAHRVLLEVLQSRDPGRARAEMEAHIDRTIGHLRGIHARRP